MFMRSRESLQIKVAAQIYYNAGKFVSVVVMTISIRRSFDGQNYMAPYGYSTFLYHEDVEPLDRDGHSNRLFYVRQRDCIQSKMLMRTT